MTTCSPPIFEGKNDNDTRGKSNIIAVLGPGDETIANPPQLFYLYK